MTDLSEYDKVVRYRQLEELQIALESLKEQVAELVEQCNTCIDKLDRIQELLGEEK